MSILPLPKPRQPEPPQPTVEEQFAENIEAQSEAQDELKDEEFILGKAGTSIDAQGIAQLYETALIKSQVTLKNTKGSDEALENFRNGFEMITKEFATSNIGESDLTISCLPRYRLACYCLNGKYLKSSGAYYNDLVAFLLLRRSIGGFQQNRWGTIDRKKTTINQSSGKWEV